LPTDFPGFDRGLLAALDRLSIGAFRAPRGLLAGPVLSRDVGRALEFADYRAYAPGDDPKLVDWRAYARLDRLYLKQYREERARTVSVLLDASASLDFGDADGHKGRFARRLAAALAWIALGRMERAHLYCLRGGSADALPRPFARAAAAPLFDALADVREEGPLQLADAVRSALAALRGYGPVVLISDLLDAHWPEALHALAARDQGGAVVQVLAAEEWEPALGDEVELQDSESGELRQTRFGPSELRDYRERLDAFVAEIAATCRRLGLVHVPLNAGEPLSDALLKRLPAAGVLQ
jgi:uncharacterized protein (DUF58 family)